MKFFTFKTSEQTIFNLLILGKSRFCPKEVLHQLPDIIYLQPLMVGESSQRRNCTGV